MKDGIIKGTGNSRYLKGADWPATYEEFKAQAEAGTLPIDLAGINPEGWQQVGDALSKGNLLDDTTCEILGIVSTSVPNDAFLKLGMGTGKYGYAVTVTVNGYPAPNVTVNGLSTFLGSPAVTDANGYVLGVASSQSVTVTIPKTFIDVAAYTTTLRSTGIITKCGINLTPNGTTAQTFTATTDGLRFSPAIAEADFCAIGGGGSGACAFFESQDNGNFRCACASGGAGGYVTNLLNHVPSPSGTYTITIGSAGISSDYYFSDISSDIKFAGSNGSRGGATSVRLQGSAILTANGGNGGNYMPNDPNNYANFAKGSNGGSGGGAGQPDNRYYPVESYNKGGVNGSSGSDSATEAMKGSGQGTPTTAFGEGGTAYSPGGNGTCTSSLSNSSGGGGSVRASTYNTTSTPTFVGGSGSVYGAGGGAVLVSRYLYYIKFYMRGGNGYQGAVLIRWRYKEANNVEKQVANMVNNSSGGGGRYVVLLALLSWGERWC